MEKEIHQQIYLYVSPRLSRKAVVGKNMNLNIPMNNYAPA